MNLEEIEKKLKDFEEMEKRLKVLEDIEEIKQLHIKYTLALNHQNFEEMITYFADEAKFEYVQHGAKLEGKEEIAKFFRNMADSQRQKKVYKGGQILIHPLISVDGDTATAYWTWYRLLGSSTFQNCTSPQGIEIPVPIPMPGFYTMEYKRVNGQWKMSKFHLTHDWPGDQWPETINIGSNS